jgi:serine/threonine-protein kinase
VALNPGNHIGPYEVVALLGAGGMGEVYRARDPRLGREVAIKILPDAFAGDPERVARFEREAQLLASLNHPNVAIIHGLEDRALVMELVEGPTLADRIAQGPLPLDEALPIARQIAEALEAAHERGVIHRDLKAANVKVTPEGRVKVLDFGLAKLVEAGGAGGAGGADGLTMSPTLSVQATHAGVILGTAAYMSPEQARGRPVDRRADIWAFGCVLFETLTGRQAFEAGETVSDAIAAILKNDPDWSALPAETPPHIRALLRRCLRKDARKRLPHIGVARMEIDEGELDRPSAVVTVRRAGWRGAVPWTVAGSLGAGLAVVLVLWQPSRSTPSTAAVRLNAALGASASLSIDPATAAVLSPDGSLMAFSAQPANRQLPQLYLRRLDQLAAVPLAGTEGGFGPFFSPDAQWIAFFAEGKLKKVSITGGAVVTLCDAPNGRGGDWSEDGTIVFVPDTAIDVGLSRVSAAGGVPERLTTPAGDEATHRWPQTLPPDARCSTPLIRRRSALTRQVSWCSRCPRARRRCCTAGDTTGGSCPAGTWSTSTTGHCLLPRSISSGWRCSVSRCRCCRAWLPFRGPEALSSPCRTPARWRMYPGRVLRPAPPSRGSARRQDRQSFAPLRPTGVVSRSPPTAASWPWTSPTASSSTCGSTTCPATRRPA